jgi:hypothetical protein
MRLRLLALLLGVVAGCSKADELDAVIGRLKSGSEDDRSNAVWELKEIRDPRAGRALAAALKDPALNVRVGAAMVLAEPGWDGPDIVAALCRASTDTDAQVRMWAVHALGKIADPASLPALQAAASDADASVRDDALSAMRNVAAGIQARSVRYHPPEKLPPGLSPDERKTYLKAHEEEWTFTITRVSEAEMRGPTLSLGFASICERPELETKGAYHGQHDAYAFLEALHRRCKRDPQALPEFRTLRAAALQRYPPPKESD